VTDIPPGSSPAAHTRLEPPSAESIAAIGIVTRGRPESLAACVESYFENCRHHERSPAFVVTDDSPDEDGQSRTRAVLQDLTRRGAPISYAGRADRIRFTEALAREAGVPIDVVRFGLLGDDRLPLTTGANRNSLVLDTIDMLVLSVDDDTRCRIAAVSDGDAQLASFSGYDPTEFWFFPGRGGALEAVAFVDADVLGCHETMLGRRVADDSGVAVTITLQGIVGDSGMGSPRYYLGLQGESRARLVASSESYQSAFRSREVVRAVRRPTLADSPFCMTTCIGFDNRVLLPPFFPVQRNADGIFGLMLHRRGDGGRTGFLPSVVVHEPDPPRLFAPDALWTESAHARMADIVMACVLAHDSASGACTAATGLIRLGRFFQELGALPLADFESRVRTVQQFRTLAFITHLESQLRTHDLTPAFWAEDVRRVIALLWKTTGAEDAIVPRDLQDVRGADAARRLSQELVGRFGQLLEAWPAIADAARRLRAQGRRLTTPL
jgi:hypothetical protein